MSLHVEKPSTGGGGGGSVPSGTGFVHVTGGSQDGTARAVNLASSDVSGVLPTANQAAQSMGGACSGNTGASTINLTGNTSITGLLPAANCAGFTGTTVGNTAASGLHLVGQATAGTASWQALAFSGAFPGGTATAGQGFFASSTTASGFYTISNDISASTSTPGALTVTQLSSSSNIPVTSSMSHAFGGGTLPGSGAIRMSKGTASYNYICGYNSGDMGALGYDPTSDIIWLGGFSSALAPNTSAVRAATNIRFNVANVDRLTYSGGVWYLSYPITGDGNNPFGSQNSPYGVHGDAAVTVGAGGVTLTAVQYAQQCIVITPTAAGTVSGFPQAASTKGYPKDIVVTAAFAVTLSDGVHTAILPPTAGLYRAQFTNGAIYVK